MTLGKIGSRLIGKAESGWHKPADWPDIRKILEADVTPQAAIDAGATKKWIMLCNPGLPGNGDTVYTFSASYFRYLRISDGVTTIEQSTNIVTPLDDGRMFWIIVYTSDERFMTPRPYYYPYTVVGPVWIYAPEHIPDFSNNRTMINGLASVQSITFKSYPQGEFEVGFGGRMLNEVNTIEDSTLIVKGKPFYLNLFLKKLPKIDISSSLTSLNSMFSNMVQVQDFGIAEKFDTTNVTDMGYVFSDCHNVRKLDLTGWSVSSVTNMRSMFNKCFNLDELCLSGWNTASLTG